LIEGFHLLEEAVKSGAEILQIFADASKSEKISALTASSELRSKRENAQGEIADLSVTFVSADVLKSLSDAGSPQGVVAEIAQSEPIDLKISAGKVLILEDVQDPGNVGTMVRTADAAGFDAVFTTTDTADIYSPKVMRSIQGSHFHLPVLTGLAVDEIFTRVKSANLEFLVTTLSDQSVSHREISAKQFALVMGNEGAGVSDFAVDSADQLVHIDMPGQAESLNVAVAAGILMFSL
jgi:TrmH family RNA methyltransferase